VALGLGALFCRCAGDLRFRGIVFADAQVAVGLGSNLFIAVGSLERKQGEIKFDEISTL